MIFTHTPSLRGGFRPVGTVLNGQRETQQRVQTDRKPSPPKTGSRSEFSSVEPVTCPLGLSENKLTNTFRSLHQRSSKFRFAQPEIFLTTRTQNAMEALFAQNLRRKSTECAVLDPNHKYICIHRFFNYLACCYSKSILCGSDLFPNNGKWSCGSQPG